MAIQWIEEEVKLKDLKEYDKNPRYINKEDFERLVESLKQDGYHQRILVDYDNTIIGGHMRKRAFKEAGFDNKDLIKVLKPERKLTEDEFKRINIKDNLNNGSWDFNILSTEWDFAELIEIGFPENLLDFDLNEEKEEQEIIEPEIKEPKKIITVLGDIWQLDNHRLMCGDSTDLHNVKKLMNNQKANMVFTDPPYNTGMKENDITYLNHMFNDSFTDEQWNYLMKSFCKIYYDFLKDNTVAYICLDWRRNHELIPYIKQHFKLSNIIVWDKVVHGLGSDYKYTYELINVCKKGKPELHTHQGEDREYSDVWHIQRKMGKDEDHATKKPVEIICRALRHASKKNDLVLDLFGGSGSTLLACENMKRNCYLMELEPKYCDITINRWQTMTGKQAIHMETGKTYDELANL